MTFDTQRIQHDTEEHNTARINEISAIPRDLSLELNLRINRDINNNSTEGLVYWYTVSLNWT